MNRVVEKKMDPVPLSWGDISLCGSNVVGAATSILSKMGYMPAVFAPLGAISNAVAFGIESAGAIKAWGSFYRKARKEDPSLISLPSFFTSDVFSYFQAGGWAGIRLALLYGSGSRNSTIVCCFFSAYSTYYGCQAASRALSEIGKSFQYVKASKGDHNWMIARNVLVHSINATSSVCRVWGVFERFTELAGFSFPKEETNCDVIKKINDLEPLKPAEQQEGMEQIVKARGLDWRQFTKVIHPDKNPMCKEEANKAIALFNNMKKLKQKAETKIDWSTFYGHSDRVAHLKYPDLGSPNFKEEEKRFGCEVLTPGFCEGMKGNIQRAKSQMQDVLNRCISYEEGLVESPLIIPYSASGLEKVKYECPEGSQEAIATILSKEIESPIRVQQLEIAFRAYRDRNSLDFLYEWLGYSPRKEVISKAVDRINHVANHVVKDAMIEEAVQGLDCDRYKIRCSF